MDSIGKLIEQLESAGNADFPALQKLVEGEVLKSQDIGLFCQLAGIYRDRQLWQEAEAILQKAKRLELSSPLPYRSLGLLLIDRDDLPWTERLQQAQEQLETCIELEALQHEQSPIAHTLLGRTYFSLGQRDLAESELRIALAIDPNYTEAKYNLAAVLSELENPPNPQIIDLLKQCVAEDPKYFLALRDLGWELRFSSPSESERYLSRALELDPGDVLIHIHYARLMFENSPPIAEAHYKTAIKLDPGDYQLHILLGLFYKHHKRLEETNLALFRAVELAPDEEQAVSTYVQFLRNLDDKNLAVRLYQTVTKSSLLPDSASNEIKRRVGLSRSLE